MLVGDPCQLGCKLLALAVGRIDLDDEGALRKLRDDAFDPADVIDVGDDAFVDRGQGTAGKQHVARRHVDDRAIILLVVGKHQPARQIDRDALKRPLFWMRSCRRSCRLLKRIHRHTKYQICLHPS